MRDRIDELFDEMKADFHAEWRRVGRWLIPAGLALVAGRIIYEVLK